MVLFLDWIEKDDMSINASQRKLTINKWLTFASESARYYPDGINQIYQGKIDGMLIKQVFTQEEMVDAKYQLEKRKTIRNPVKYGETFGTVLVEKVNNPDQYFQDVKVYRTELKRIFASGYEARIEALLSKMSGERKVEIASENNQAYAPAQIRFMEPNKGGLIIHKGRQNLDNPPFDYLREITRIYEHLSYFAVIDKPEEGGELIVYDLPSEEAMKDIDDLVNSSVFDQCERSYIIPDIGDLVLFHGGPIWHKVSDVKGKRSRISIGGFVALSKDDQKFFYWS